MCCEQCTSSENNKARLGRRETDGHKCECRIKQRIEKEMKDLTTRLGKEETVDELCEILKKIMK